MKYNIEIINSNLWELNDLNDAPINEKTGSVKKSGSEKGNHLKALDKKPTDKSHPDKRPPTINPLG